MRVKVYGNVYRHNETLTNLSDEIRHIKQGTYSGPIQEYHHEVHEASKRNLKKNLRVIIPCIDHEQDPITTNGLVHFDVDQKDNRELDFKSLKSLIIALPETAFAFQSINGGLKFAIQTDLKVTCNERGRVLYKYAYDQCHEWLLQYVKFSPDQSVKAATCTMFTSYDPDAYYNPSPNCFSVLKEADVNFKRSLSNSVPQNTVDSSYIVDLFNTMPKDAGYNDRLIAHYMLLSKFEKCEVIRIATSHWKKDYKAIVAQVESQSNNANFGNISKVEELVKSHGRSLPMRDFHKSINKVITAQTSAHKFDDLLSVDEAQTQLRLRVREVFEEGKSICIRSSAGAGKTEIALGEMVKQARTKKILYLTPTHKLGREAAERFCEIASKNGSLNHFTFPNHIYGKLNTDHNGVPVCEVEDIRERYSRVNLSIPSFECENCMYAEGCRYTEQFNRTSNVRIQTNANLFIEPSKYENGFSVQNGSVEMRSGNWTPDVLVIDEDFIKFDDFTITEKTKHPVLNQIMSELVAAYDVKGFDNTSLPQLLWAILEPRRAQIAHAHEMSQIVNTRSTAGYIASYKASTKNEKLALELFCEYLQANHKDMRGLWLRKDDDTLSLNGSRVRDIKARFKNVPTLILDATAQEAVLQKVLPKVKVANINVRPNPHVQIFQCQNASFSKEFLKKSENLSSLVLQLNRLIKLHQPEKVGLLTYKNAALQKDFDTYLASRLQHDDIVASHFGDIRGTNIFDDVNLFFVIGRQDIGYQHVVAKGEALFGESLPQERRNFPLPIRMSDGKAKSLYNHIFVDERLAATYDHICRAETLQAVARVRPIHGKPKVAYIFANEALGADVSITDFFNFDYAEQPPEIKRLKDKGFVRTTPKEMKKLGFTNSAVSKPQRARIISNLVDIGCSLKKVSFKDAHYKDQTHEYLVDDLRLFEQYCDNNEYTII